MNKELKEIHKMIDKELYRIKHSPIGYYYRNGKKQKGYDVSKAKCI